MRTTTFGGGQGGRSAAGAATGAGAAAAASVGAEGLLTAALQGAAFIFCPLCFAVIGFFAAGEEVEGGLAGGDTCVSELLWEEGVDEFGGLTSLAGCGLD
ncbi:MAG TPA: hypothetical protein VKR60_12635 [Candidatus Sulfotelmatobacter sp.]|nr:hypothetical protein [Candidatus Sulfotelmatobacter sp.]